jgi:hypothetical protein
LFCSELAPTGFASASKNDSEMGLEIELEHKSTISGIATTIICALELP